MTASTSNELIFHARELRWEIGGNIHENLVEAIYTDAARIADRAVTRDGEKERWQKN